MKGNILMEPCLKELTATCVSVFVISDEVRPLPSSIFKVHDCTQEEINDVCERIRQIASKIKERDFN